MYKDLSLVAAEFYQFSLDMLAHAQEEIASLEKIIVNIIPVRPYPRRNIIAAKGGDKLATKKSRVFE